MAGPFGYRSQADYVKALNREFDQLSTHNYGEHGERPGTERGTRKRDFALKGKPGSPERLKQIEGYLEAPNKNLLNTVARSLEGEKVYRAVQLVQSDPTPQSIQEAAQLVTGYEDVQVARAAINALQPTGYVDDFVRELVGAAEQVEAAKASQDEEAERKRLATRQQLLAHEYQRVRGRPEEEQAVDDLAQHLGDALYSPELADDEARVLLRSQSEMAKRQRDAANTFLTHAALDEEFRRIGAPGSRWSDEEREKWEAELRQGSLEAFDRINPSPEEGARAAFESVVHDRAFKGASPMKVALDREFEAMALHDSDSPHRNEMRRADAEEFERTHDTDGRPRDSDW